MKLLLLFVVMLVDNTNLSLAYFQNDACMLDASISGVLTRGAEIDLKTPRKDKTSPFNSSQTHKHKSQSSSPEHAMNLSRQQPWQRSAALMISKRCVPSHSIRNFRQRNMQIRSVTPNSQAPTTRSHLNRRISPVENKRGQHAVRLRV